VGSGRLGAVEPGYAGRGATLVGMVQRGVERAKPSRGDEDREK
jgi:hypothetical protein